MVGLKDICHYCGYGKRTREGEEEGEREREREWWTISKRERGWMEGPSHANCVSIDHIVARARREGEAVERPTASKFDPLGWRGGGERKTSGEFPKAIITFATIPPLFSPDGMLLGVGAKHGS